ncbi:MAG: hypothetical protein QM737_22575 [Ferruginibacter sp.]
MTLNELYELFINSNRNDWKVIPCWGANSGPSFKNKFGYQLHEGDANALQVKQFSNIAAYKNDLSISISWGLDVYDMEDMNRVNEPWAVGFPNPAPGTLKFLDFYYNDSLVNRLEYIVVDGGRCYMFHPRPQAGGNGTYTRTQYEFLNKLNQITGSDVLDHYMRMAGITIHEEDDWEF